MEIQVHLNRLRSGIKYAFAHDRIIREHDTKNVTTGVFEKYLDNNGIKNSGLQISNYDTNGVVHIGQISTPKDWMRSASVIIIPQLNSDINYYIHQYL